MKILLMLLSTLAMTFTLATAEMKCAEGKCGAQSQKTMKCSTGKCSNATKETKKIPKMKCAAGKCGASMKEKVETKEK